MRWAGAVLVAAALLTACGAEPPPPAPPPASPTVPATSTATAPPPDLAARGQAADAFARGRGGSTGIVVRDRVTGQVWRNAEARTRFRAASTVKLALAVDLLVRARTGQIALTPADRAAIRAMLVSSDNAAADRLWARFGRAAIGRRFGTYGLLSATGTADWATVRCTPEDLERLVTYVLESTHPADRATLVRLLRGVVPEQRWGVFGVVATALPGGKNGWTPSPAAWSVTTAGFLGPGGRYTVVVMTDRTGTADDFVAGVETVTGSVTTLFLGLL